MRPRAKITPVRASLVALWVLAALLAAVAVTSGAAGADEGGVADPPVRLGDADESDEADDADDADEADADEDADGASERLRGRLQADGEPVPGVTIRVEDADGEQVAEGVSDEDGQVEIDLPGPGSYRAMLDTDTLPEGIVLRDPDRDTIEPTVTPGSTRPVAFPLVDAEEAEEEGGFDIPTRRLARSAVDGVNLGLLIGMTSIGLSLVFGTTRLINFAHGDMVTFGMVFAFLLHRQWAQLPLVAAGLLAIIAGAALGAGMERGLWDPLRRRQFGIIQLLVVSIGLSFVLRYLILLIYGSRRQGYADFAVSPSVSFGPFTTTMRDLVTMLISIVVLAAVGYMLTRTRLGKAMRAVADDRDLAESSGIDVRFVILVVWVLGGALAAFGGVLYGATVEISWLSGFRLLLLMFAGVILGGIGTAFGALVGSLVVGLGVEISSVWLGGQLKYVWALLVMIVVLLVRPQGILGTRERVG